MKPLQELPAESARRIDVFLTDIDDTLTSEGKLLPEAYTALWRLQRAGIKVIPVTGRPAGWCDLIIRQWPVEAVIGENGAFACYWRQGRPVRMLHPSVADSEQQKRLQGVRDAVLRRVPGSRVAQDQFCRLYDLAIDFNEDPPRLGYEAGEKIQAVCEEYGAQAKISSIHVNAWFGDYSKRHMAELFLTRQLGLDEAELQDRVLFCGDSPNDEPLFAHFMNSVAVANISDFLTLLTVKPAYLASLPGGKGFVEIVDFICRFH